MIRFHNVLAISALLCSLTLVGCGGSGPAVGRVTGTVTVDGQPASGVKVNFQPTEGGRGSTAVTDQSGQYDLIYSPTTMGAVVGTHTVTISGSEPGLDDAGGGGGQMLTAASSIPREYVEMKKTVTVESGKNTHDLSYP